jgi:hypothetical protein
VRRPGRLCLILLEPFAMAFAIRGACSLLGESFASLPFPIQIVSPNMYPLDLTAREMSEGRRSARYVWC